MTPFPVTLALTLTLLAVLVKAGCVSSPEFNNQTQTFPEEKYVFVEHHINTNGVTVSGECTPPVWIDFPMYSFDETKEYLQLESIRTNPSMNL